MSAPWRSEEVAAADRATAPWDWLVDAHADFDARMTATGPEHPCYFGVRGQRRGDNRFAAVDDRLPGFGLDALARTVRAFRDEAWTGAPRKSLIVFAGPPRAKASLEEDTGRFWALLEGLSERDRDPWPSDVPEDPADPAWQWCFAGEPWFTFMGSPAYGARRSRDLGPCLTLVFQTRRVFEGIGGSTPAGRSAKRRIRAGLAGYDTVAPHPHMGDPRRSSTHKWRQYALPDDTAVADPQACPFRPPASRRPGRAAP
ncbi:YqcI/YcgG family protein [Nocardiopsis sp. RSe5-2]|uniref:YqcI/YcgG family protein n=1 Tax=Nocardiopsis endophytica TaxID=3018445 RepID=A0ABT4U9D4_9ACTN|nr:YqcI/YcgG family protein [Nocardiopsis endophytica]MDA2813557.1 YqcI/YcgG family protein [Nocardiopsis endophytica]